MRAKAAAVTPTIRGAQSLVMHGVADTPQTCSLAGQAYDPGDYPFAFYTTSGDIGITAAGSADDTYAPLLDAGDGGNVSLEFFQGTIVGALDASLIFTLSNDRRGGGGLITIADGVHSITGTPTQGATTSPNAGSITVPANHLVIGVIGIRGAHNVTDMENARPPDWDQVYIAQSNSDNPGSSSLSSLIVCEKDMAAGGASGDMLFTNGLTTPNSWSGVQFGFGPV